MSRNSLVRNVVVALFFSAFLFARTADASVLFISPASVSASVSKTFTVRVSVDSGGGAGINAAEATVKFDTALLSVVSATKDGSIFNLWTTEPTFSNTNGTITLAGGSTSAYKGSAGTIATITFRPIAEGTASISFDKGSVLAADGRGTESLTQSNPAAVTITRAKALPPPPPPPPPPASDFPAEIIDIPAAPKIASSTSAEEEKWSSDGTLKLSWDIPGGVTGVRILLDGHPSSTPTEFLSGAPKTHEFKDLPDGVWYFHIQFRNSAGWGAPSHRKIQIDRTKPDSLAVVIEQKSESDAMPKIIFSANDAVSGIDRYEIALDGGEPKSVLAKDLVSAPYQTAQLSVGSHVAVVRAIDKAGNASDPVTKIFSVAAVVEEEKNMGISVPYWLLIIVGLVLIALAVGLFVLFIAMKAQRIQVARHQKELVAETKATSKRAGEVFIALKQEVEEQLNSSDLAGDAQAKERITDELQGALDVSAELIQKELSDIEILGGK